MATFGAWLHSLLRVFGLGRTRTSREWVRPQNAITRAIEADLQAMMAPAPAVEQATAAAPVATPAATTVETQVVAAPEAEESKKKAGRAA
jgi:hypothetical protein